MTSRLIVNSIRHTGASADAITLDNSGNATFPANVTCSGTASGFGGGKVLQVVSAVTTTQVSTTDHTAFISTTLTASITPASSSNKVLIITSQSLQTRGDGSNNSSGKICDLSLRRGDHTGTEIATSQFGGSWMSGNANLPRVYHMGSFVLLDSPSTTNAQSYTVAIKCASSDCAVYAQDGGETGTITLIEIEA